MKTITKHIQDLISDKGVLTGSQLFGVASKDSDYDFLVMYHDINFQDLIDNDFEYLPAKYNQDQFFCAYGKSSTGDIINVLTFASQLEYEAHVHATNSMMILLESKQLSIKSISEKSKRIEVFEHLKKIYRITNKKEN